MGLILDGTTGISASGNIYGANIIVTGNFSPDSLSVVGNVQGAYIKGNGSELTNLNGSNVTGTVSSATTATSATTAGTVTTASQPNITSVGTLNSLAVTANVTGGNLIYGSGVVSGTGSVYATAFVGSLTGTATSAVSATTAATVTTAAQPNITSVGTLTSVTSSGLISTTGNIAGGNVIATAFVGSLTGTATSAVSATTAATVTTAAQPNITSVGTLTSVNVTGNITSGNITSGIISATGTIYGGAGVFGAGLSVTGNITATGNLNYQNVTDLVVGDPLIYIGANNTADLVDLGLVASANVSGIYQHLGFVRNHSTGVWGLFGNVVAEPTTVIDWANAVYQPMQTGAITSTAATATGNITGGNILTGGLISATGQVTGSQFNGSGAGLSSIPGGNVTGTVSSATTAATVTTAAQPNITSVGTLGSVYVSGAISVGGGIVNTAGNGVSNIGGTGAYFNTVFAKATSAQYADLAEMYAADSGYAPGTVVAFGGAQEVTLSTTPGDRRVAGVISTNPSYLMNSTLSTPYAVPVALTGRVPTMVTGDVRKGDLMVSNGDGTARADADPQVGAVIGKALADFTGDKGTIEIVVGRL